PGIRIVVDREDANAPQDIGIDQLDVLNGGAISRGGDGQRDREDGSKPRAGAVRFDHAAMGRDQQADDGQAESEAAVMPARALVGLAEAVEYVRQEFRGNPLPGVTYDDTHRPPHIFERHLDTSAARREP